MCMITDSPEFARRMTELPPLPAAVAEVLDALRHGPPSLERCVELIERDPALAARTLRLANSAFYGRQGRIGSITSACLMLGLRTVMGLLTAATLRQCLRPLDCPGFDPDAHWRRAMGRALTASMLAPQLEQDPGEAFLAGLVTDLGMLMLAWAAPTQMGEALRLAAQDGELVAHEIALLGHDHVEMGTAVARRWHFPEAIVRTLQVTPRQWARLDGRPAELADLVSLSQELLAPLEAGCAPEAALMDLPEALWLELELAPDERLPFLQRVADGLAALVD